MEVPAAAYAWVAVGPVAEEPSPSPQEYFAIVPSVSLDAAASTVQSGPVQLAVDDAVGGRFCGPAPGAMVKASVAEPPDARSKPALGVVAVARRSSGPDLVEVALADAGPHARVAVRGSSSGPPCDSRPGATR